MKAVKYIAKATVGFATGVIFGAILIAPTAITKTSIATVIALGIITAIAVLSLEQRKIDKAVEFIIRMFGRS